MLSLILSNPYVLLAIIFSVYNIPQVKQSRGVDASFKIEIIGAAGLTIMITSLLIILCWLYGKAYGCTKYEAAHVAIQFFCEIPEKVVLLF